MGSIDIPTQRQGPIHIERQAKAVILTVAETEIRLTLDEAWQLAEALDQLSSAH